MKEAKLTNEQLRIKAIELLNDNWKITDICSTLNCSRAWLYKWIKRKQFNSNLSSDESKQWYIEQSRRPKTKQKKIDSITEQQVLETRKRLMSTPFMQYGPQAIFYNLQLRNITPPPVWAIARILNQNQVTHKKRTNAYEPKGKSYPYDYLLSQQMDFVGPRYIHSDNGVMRYYFLDMICCDTHFAQASVLENLSWINVCNGLIHF